MRTISGCYWTLPASLMLEKNLIKVKCSTLQSFFTELQVVRMQTRY